MPATQFVTSINQCLKMFHCCCNLPPLMKRNQMRHWRTRVLQNLAQLQRVELQRLKSNANLHRTIPHKVES
jgi:hypothetical protein